ncbi:MAG: FHA domain-containing protein [Phycisphaeraceae bacterium]|nr:FHA domain-containing protein [Phycisphaeraceae bacterium]
MSDTKIAITWDDVNSPEVEKRLERQTALQKAHEHYLQQRSQATTTGQAGAAPIVRPGRSRFWRHRLFYTAVFGLLAGILAWAASEGFRVAVPNRYLEMVSLVQQFNDIQTKKANNEILDFEAESKLKTLYEQHSESPYTRILADQSLSFDQQKKLIHEHEQKDVLIYKLHQFIGYALIGLFFATVLCIAEPLMSRHWRSVVINGAVAMVVATVGALIMVLFFNMIYVKLGGDQRGAGFVRQVIARSVMWGLFGLFLTIAPGLAMWNIKRFSIGLIGGFVGGLAGGMFFDPVMRYAGHNDVLSRFIGLVAIGLASGIATGLLESAAKAGWLKVTSGLIAGKQFIIYRNPTYIGSSPICEIYLFNDAAVGAHHAAIHSVRGGYEIEDLNDHSQTYLNGRPIIRARLRGGDEIQVGSSTFIFQERKQTVVF